jgi:hypothetical protein
MQVTLLINVLFAGEILHLSPVRVELSKGDI